MKTNTTTIYLMDVAEQLCLAQEFNTPEEFTMLKRAFEMVLPHNAWKRAYEKYEEMAESKGIL